MWPSNQRAASGSALRNTKASISCMTNGLSRITT
jgi:hypothetical protein